MLSEPGPIPARRGPVAAGLAGALAGACVGLVDGLWTLDRAAQFVPGLTDKLRFLTYLAALYAAAGLVLAPALAGLGWLLGRSLVGDAARQLGSLGRQAHRAGGPRALRPLALAVTLVPAVGGSLALAFWLAQRELAQRKHLGLIIAVAMAAALIAVVVGALVAASLARPLERGLHRLGPGLRAVLAAPGAAPLAALILIGGAAAVAAALTWPTTRLLPLRPYLAGLGLALLLRPAARRTGSTGDLIAARSRWSRLALAVAGAMIVVAAVISLGGASAVQKAAERGSGLGAPLGRAVRALFDLDRDGASPILAGGDCDDLDREVHPGAAEIPDDGLDNNCVGGDATARPSHDPTYVARPPGLPDDFDVVLVTIDTLRADHVGAYGYPRPTTPRLDAIAAEGAVFVNAWAHAPSTRYSMPAILTGRMPLAVDYVDIPNQWPGLADANTTIAEVLAGRGFTGVAVTNYWYFDKVRRMDQGFARYDNSNKRLHSAIPGEGPARTKGSSSKEQTDKAIELIDQIGDGRLFLWVHYYDPHADYERHSGQFGDREIDRYDDEIHYTDQQIGRLVDALAQRGRWARTVMVITGDHGEGFGEHGIDRHGYDLYAAQTKVPLIVRVPGVAGSRPTVPAGHVDILPTLANLAGATPTAALDGQSLVDAIAGGPQRDADRLVFQELSYEGNHEHRGAASKRCHALYNVSPSSSWEAYRIERDPDERDDVAGAPGPCAETMHGLAAWFDQRQVPAGAAEALLAGPPAIAAPLEVELGDAARLLAVELPAAPVRPGASFAVTYTFAARGTPPAGARVFVHFEHGPSRFQGDHEPTRPLAWWRDGQFIRYTRTVAVPASARPGEYEVWLGLFKGRDRLPASSATTEVVDDRARVGRVTVAP